MRPQLKYASYFRGLDTFIYVIGITKATYIVAGDPCG